MEHPFLYTEVKGGAAVIYNSVIAKQSNLDFCNQKDMSGFYLRFILIFYNFIMVKIVATLEINVILAMRIYFMLKDKFYSKI